MPLEIAKTSIVKPKSIFLNRNFMLLFSGKIISQLWDRIYAFALSWFILELTKSSLQMAVFLVISSLVGGIVSPFGGIMADRFNRKTLLVLMDIIRGIGVIIVAFLLYNEMLDIWMLYLSAFFLAFCGAIATPSAGAIIPDIVETDQLTQAQSIDQLVFSICAIVGMLISSILYNLIGISAIFILNALSYLISGVLVFLVDIPIEVRDKLKKYNSLFAKIKSTINELSEGFQYVRKNRLIYSLLKMNTVFNLIALPLVMVYTPYLFNVILKAMPVQLALPQGAIWIGIILGTFCTPLFLKKYKLKNAIFLSLLISSIFICIETLVLYPAIGSYFSNWHISIFLTIPKIIGGLSLSFFMIPMNVIFQKYTAKEFRGRFWGLSTSLVTLSTAVGYFISGFLAQRIWLGFLFYGTAIIMFVLDLWISNIKELKELDE